MVLAACGGSDPHPTVDAPAVIPDGGANCQAIGAIGSFYRRAGNPRLVAGGHTFTDGMIDTTITDPDLRWNDAAQRWDLYYGATHATAFGVAGTPVIRHATSTDLSAWTIDETPLLAPDPTTTAWDHDSVGMPSVVYSDQYVMAYSNGTAVGFAMSPDGVTWTRREIHLIGANFYNGVIDSQIADPELIWANGRYHLFVSSRSPNAHGVAYAISDDAQHWVIQQTPLPTLLRASIDPTSGGDQPTATYDEAHCRWELWLVSDQAGETDAQPVVDANMAGVYHATSGDAFKWTINYAGTRDLTWAAGTQGEHLGLQRGADVAAKSTGRYMVYVGYDDQNVPAGATLPGHSGGLSGVMTLQLATRDAP